jgi:tetratricopeptide (TPR) repeat protein
MKKGLFVFAMLFLAFNSYGQVGLPYYDSAMVKYEKKDYSGAVYELSRAIELENSNSIFVGGWYAVRGALKGLLMDYRGALADYDKAISLTPKYKTESLADYYNGRGTIKYQLKKYEDAIRDLDESIKLAPGNGRHYMMRGLAKLGINSLKDSGCLDLSKAGELGIQDAYEAIKEYCN